MKLSMKDLQNITPTGVNIILKYEEGYSGIEKDVTMRIYPLTVAEKIEIQQLNDKLQLLIKLKEPTEAQETAIVDLNSTINIKYAFYSVKKVMEDITEEFIRDSFPKSWFMTIFKATLEAEGINPKKIDEEKN